jgi:hypothetical protein
MRVGLAGAPRAKVRDRGVLNRCLKEQDEGERQVKDYLKSLSVESSGESVRGGFPIQSWGETRRWPGSRKGCCAGRLSPQSSAPRTLDEMMDGDGDGDGDFGC